MLDKLNEWFVDTFVFKKQARQVVNDVTKEYFSFKSKHPDISHSEILKSIFNVDTSDMNEEGKKLLDICTETIHGICYLTAFLPDMRYNIMWLRSQRMSNFIDKALSSKGFAPLPSEQKKKILDEMSAIKFPSEEFTDNV